MNWVLMENADTQMYESPTSRVKHVYQNPFPDNRGVKQGSVHSDNQNCGVSIQGTFVGTAVHANDVRCIAPNNDVLGNFTNEVGMKLYPTKLEIVRIS